MQPVKVVTFNVCGMKNLFSFQPWAEWKTLAKSFQEMGADIVCFQETKMQLQDLTREYAIVEGFQSFFTFSMSKKGYSGVVTYVKNTIPVLAAEEGLSGWARDLSSTKKPYRETNKIGGYPDTSEELGSGIDQEGRTLVLDIGACVLICLYCPANSQGDKLEYRETFFDLLDQRVKNLRAQGREVMILGDINVAPNIIDSAHSMQEFRKAGLPKHKWDEEYLSMSKPRQIVNEWLVHGFIDTTRACNPDRGRIYTCWDLRVDGRGANFGSRIDLIIVSKGIGCTESDVLLSYYGSDHCPVFSILQLDIAPPQPGYLVPLLSRKRCAGFASIQSFWSAAKSKPASPAPRSETPPSPLKNGAKKLPPVASKVTKKTLLDHFNPKEKVSSPVVTDELLASQLWSSNGSQRSSQSSQPNTKESSGSWKQIFSPIVCPKCYHNEDAKLVKCNKAGPNKGRMFWTCVRPQGGDGDENFRCKYFKWS